ncbi:hypothetical protein C8J56DRAFT_964621 [Mycena floridula]|nr:hypothetical protein C8J56DRAFT_964621 [Mycena floridula]
MVVKPLTPEQVEELTAIWDRDGTMRLPSNSSRQSWAKVRDADLQQVNQFFWRRRSTAKRRGKAIPKDSDRYHIVADGMPPDESNPNPRSASPDSSESSDESEPSSDPVPLTLSSSPLPPFSSSTLPAYSPPISTTKHSQSISNVPSNASAIAPFNQSNGPSQSLQSHQNPSSNFHHDFNDRTQQDMSTAFQNFRKENSPAYNQQTFPMKQEPQYNTLPYPYPQNQNSNAALEYHNSVSHQTAHWNGASNPLIASHHHNQSIPPQRVCGLCCPSGTANIDMSKTLEHGSVLFELASQYPTFFAMDPTTGLPLLVAPSAFLQGLFAREENFHPATRRT